MSIFFKPNLKQSDVNQATRLTKALSIMCTAGLLNVMSLPAQAAAVNNRAKAAHQQQALAGENAYTKLANLTTKFEIEQKVYQDTQAKALAGRNIFKKTLDGVTSLFTDNSEVVEQVNPETLADTSDTILSLQEQLAADQRTLIAQLHTQTLQMQKAGFSKQDFLEHRDLILEMDKRYQTLQGLLTQLEKASTDNDRLQAMQALNEQIDAWEPESRQTDVENLPWGMPDSDVREPIVSQSSPAVLQPASYQLNGHTEPYSAIHQWRDTEYRFGQMLLNKTALDIGAANFQKVTGISGQTDAGKWAVLKALPAKVQPADLTETSDIQITQAIKDKAAELNHNPAEIYKWVHDNIEFVPTYGSIQGSDYTMQTMRGNSFDTASLLIALLRASGIPARYVYGTVDIPAKQAMDWVGGVNSIDAAQNLLGQGGVPNKGFMNGGQAEFLRMEHMWVEANMNAVSRGIANNKTPNNSQNQWIPLDASYKSYTRTQGIDLETAVPFDAEALIEKAQDGATIDEATGSVKNLNQGAVNQAIEDYQADVQAYLEQNHPDATVGDLLGTDRIKPYNSHMISPVLPYQVRTVISDYQVLPDGMRHFFIVQGYQDDFEKRNAIGMGDTPKLYAKIPTVDLQGKPLALSFAPATAADEDKLLGMLPKPDADGNIDPNQIPSSFPRSIGMKAEITLDGEALVSTNNYPFGTEVDLQLGFKSPSMGSNTTFQNTAPLSDKTIRAGEYVAIGYDMQGISQQQLENTKTTLENAKAKLENYQATKEETALAGITKHDLTGAMMQAGVQSYFAINQAQDTLAAKQAGNVIKNHYMSYGSFATYLHPSQRYGIIFGASAKGMQMDIDQLMYTAVSKDNDRETLTNFLISQGPRESANEHLIPEQLFDDPDTEEKEVEGISAVKAMQIAASEGQTIYTINQQNYAEILPKLQLQGSTLTDINNAMWAGRVVTVHEKTLSYKGWTGDGYSIVDPNTGGGAYLINGGANGAIILFIGMVVLSFTLACIIESTGLALTVPHVAGALIFGIGAVLTGLSVLGFIGKEYCVRGFTLMKGGATLALLPSLLGKIGLGASAKLIGAKAFAEVAVRVAVPVVGVLEPFSKRRICDHI